MEEKYTLDQLTVDSVSVKKERYMIEGGQEIIVGKPHRKTYENSEKGRKEVRDELPEAQRNAIFAVWENE